MTTAKIKAAQAQAKKLRDSVEKKYKKTPEQLYAEREKRLYDAVQGKVPDRVPVVWGGTFYACKNAGIPYSSAYYDASGWRNAYAQMLIDLDVDGYGSADYESGSMLEALQTNYTKWPGGNLPKNVGQQVIEQEYMKEDEYDLFLADPSDFILRVWMPRIFGSMQPLTKLPPLMTLGANPSAWISMLATPEFAKFAKAMQKAAQEQAKWREEMGDFEKAMAAVGTPPALSARGGVQPPFSGFTNTFRTFRGAARDMFKQPEKLKAALDKFVDYRIATSKPAVRRAGFPTIGNCGEAHRVSDEILSPKQFQEFVWPNWKRCINYTLVQGYDIIAMFFEGKRDKQLEYFTDFPRHSLFIRFAETDIFRAKQVFGDRVAIMGNVPIQMLQMGSVTDVEEYCKKLIKVCGKNGGFILRCSTDYTQEAKPKNVKAMIDTVHKFGAY